MFMSSSRQTPVGTQQMMSLSIDAFRSGVYWAGEPALVPLALRESTWDEARAWVE